MVTFADSSVIEADGASDGLNDAFDDQIDDLRNAARLRPPWTYLTFRAHNVDSGSPATFKFIAADNYLIRRIKGYGNNDSTTVNITVTISGNLLYTVSFTHEVSTGPATWDTDAPSEGENYDPSVALFNELDRPPILHKGSEYTITFTSDNAADCNYQLVLMVQSQMAKW